MAGSALVADLLQHLHGAADADRAVQERAYLKSDLVHLGVPVPDIRRLTKQAVRTYGLADAAAVRSAADELWATGIHEARMAAVELVRDRQRLLTADDLPWLERLLREARTWAIVDEIARHTVAGLAVRDASVLDTFDRWVTDPDFWIRRSAVLGLSQLLREGRELDRFFRYADLLLPETEFFIRKVLGWVAREVARRQPAPVSEWCWRNLDRMNLVTLREAAKPLPDGEALLAAYRSARR